MIVGMTCRKCLRILGLFSSGKGKLREDFIAVYNILMKGRRDGGVDLFVPESAGRT